VREVIPENNRFQAVRDRKDAELSGIPRVDELHPVRAESVEVHRGELAVRDEEIARLRAQIAKP
jgi:hypothetical protein